MTFKGAHGSMTEPAEARPLQRVVGCHGTEPTICERREKLSILHSSASGSQLLAP